jgi:hypothetical protein
MLQLRNKHVNTLTEIILLITYAFRLFIVFVIATFIFTRWGMVAEVIWGTALAFALLILDFFFTIRMFWECFSSKIEKQIGVIYKLGLIAVAISYSISIYVKIPYWLYAGFGFFVAALIALDFLLLKYNEKN